MKAIILDKIKPSLIAKLQSLAIQNQRTLEEEITVILENVTKNQPIITNNKTQWSTDFFARTSGC
ncbi:hypothetical protein ACN4EE_18015 [Geminocystis sp. CENA526]|uniref:hypothetical protein n=1 Tax=Geminocystis sp. CENA526 TaxID=1355871 RepID=UPI003D6EF3D1